MDTEYSNVVEKLDKIRKEVDSLVGNPAMDRKNRFDLLQIANRITSLKLVFSNKVLRENKESVKVTLHRDSETNILSMKVYSNGKTKKYPSLSEVTIDIYEKELNCDRFLTARTSKQDTCFSVNFNHLSLIGFRPELKNSVLAIPGELELRYEKYWTVALGSLIKVDIIIHRKIEFPSCVEIP